MTTLEKNTVIVIDPNENKAEEVRKMLTRSMKGVALINTKCLSSHRQEVIELVKNGNYQKIFYGCNAKFFNEMVKDFKINLSLNFKNGEIEHIGWRPDISKIVVKYWNYFWKKNGPTVFLITVSRREESFSQEL